MVQSDKVKLWRAYVKYLLLKHEGKKTLKQILKTYSKADYERFKKNPRVYIWPQKKFSNCKNAETEKGSAKTF